MTYTLYSSLTWAAWAVAWPWLEWKRHAGGQEWLERTGHLPACAGGIWVHAASVGEVAAARPLVLELLRRGERVLVTVMTPTGHAAAGRVREHGALTAFPPLDLPPLVERALESAAPRALLIVETELWPNLIVRAAARGVTVGIVNGRLSAASARRYGSAAFPARRLLGGVSFVACRSEEDRGRYLDLGVSAARLSVAGSLKFDALSEPPAASERDEIRRELRVPIDARVVVFGSVRSDEEEPVGLTAASLVQRSGVHAVIAPRHLGRVDAIAARLSGLGLSCARRSESSGGPAEPVRVTLLDTTGELGRVYSIAEVAFVGGTLAPYGGHNPLEPAAMGVPVVFGTHTSSCADDATLLVDGGAALRVDDAGGLAGAITTILDDPELRARMGERALLAVSGGRGATARVMELLRSAGILGPVPPGEQ